MHGMRRSKARGEGTFLEAAPASVQSLYCTEINIPIEPSKSAD